MTPANQDSSSANPTDANAQSPPIPAGSPSSRKAPIELFGKRKLQNLAKKHRVRLDSLSRLTEGPFKHLKIYSKQVTQEDQSKWEQVYEEYLQQTDADELKRASSAVKREARIDRRARNEHDRILEIVKARWNLDAKDIDDFAAHSNEVASNRILRTTTKKLPKSLEQKIYCALVAWVRHNKTDYDSRCQQTKQNAFEELERKREELGGCPAKRADRELFYEMRKQALMEFREGKAEAHDELHKEFTAEAIRWLSERETELGRRERLAREPGGIP